MRQAGRSLAVVMVVFVSALSVPGAASAKNPPGSAKWCKHHPHSPLPACQKSGGGGTGGSSLVTVTVSPNPIVETGNSDIYAVVMVEADPLYAEQTVEIVSALNFRCRQGVFWSSNQGTFNGSTATATIDNNGNATLTVLGAACAPGPVQVIADVLAGSNPTYTTTFTISPPAPQTQI